MYDTIHFLRNSKSSKGSNSTSFSKIQKLTFHLTLQSHKRNQTPLFKKESSYYISPLFAPVHMPLPCKAAQENELSMKKEAFARIFSLIGVSVSLSENRHQLYLYLTVFFTCQDPGSKCNSMSKPLQCFSFLYLLYSCIASVRSPCMPPSFHTSLSSHHFQGGKDGIFVIFPNILKIVY